MQKWLVGRLLGNRSTRRFLEKQLIAAHPILSNPQMRIAPPGHFYSPLPDITALADGQPLASTVWDGVNLNADGQRQLLGELAEKASAFDWPEEQTPTRRFWLKNGYYEHCDSVTLFSFIRRFCPRRIMEVGSGFTSALMLDTNDLYCDSSMQLTFIEPYPKRLNQLLTPRDAERARIIVSGVQRVPVEEFDQLEAGDFLFIDSSHVSKYGSDVNHLLFNVLPRLRPGVMIHMHDIFFPFEYPLQWLKDGRAWNELYLLRAFLQYNNAFEILFSNSFVTARYPEDVKRLIPLMDASRGAAMWLKKL
ncbi:MAG TPA: class I SAM-dependent methyltransferase [Pirellulales bacterium]|nr:class I SAM-dependent methyltransferase [Pirellulales bacterium]